LAGIYIHFPFCRQACHYCNFHFATSLRSKNELVAALLKEIELQHEYLSGEAIETIYFGGGTPSLCSTGEITSILEKLYSTFKIVENAEVTLEANPDDISARRLKDWNSAGINRLSIGIQSFYDEDLQWMNRAHNAGQAIECLNLAVDSFANITIDLIYGTPPLTNEKWKQNVETAMAFNIPHISCYALTVEPKTALDKLIRLNKSPGIDPDKQSEQFLLLMEWMGKANYEHYEISNFAKHGFRSRHNSSYWQGKKYLGFGPSAHSFDGNARWWNIANNKSYIEAINRGVIPFEKEELTNTQKLNEYIMISLRTIEGLDLSRVGKEISVTLKATSKKYIENGLLKMENNILRLTNEGRLLADGIAADLFAD